MKNSDISSSFNLNIEEKLSFQELLFEGLNTGKAINL